MIVVSVPVYGLRLMFMFMLAALTGLSGLFKRKDIKLGRYALWGRMEVLRVKWGLEDGYLQEILYTCMKLSNIMKIA